MQKNKTNNLPPVGMAVWLLSGGRLIDRIEWIINNGFMGVSFLQSVTAVDEEEREEAAAAITSAQLHVTYHGNVHHKLKESGELDSDFSNRMIDDVIWWHENTNGVYSCCSDPINIPQDDGKASFCFDANKQHVELMAQRLDAYGIRVGIENSFGGKNRYCTLNDFTRFREMCSSIHFGMLLDAGHVNIHVRNDGEADEDNTADYVRKLPFEILEVHFSDNLGKKDEHKQLGYGNTDLAGLFKGLKSNNFKGKFTVEVCVDILSGQYASDIYDPKQTDALLVSRDQINEAWSALD